MKQQKHTKIREKTKKATFLLDDTLPRELRVYAATIDTSMLDIVEKALSAYIKE